MIAVGTPPLSGSGLRRGTLCFASAVLLSGCRGLGATIDASATLLAGMVFWTVFVPAATAAFATMLATLHLAILRPRHYRVLAYLVNAWTSAALVFGSGVLGFCTMFVVAVDFDLFDAPSSWPETVTVEGIKFPTLGVVGVVGPLAVSLACAVAIFPRLWRRSFDARGARRSQPESSP